MHTALGELMSQSCALSATLPLTKMWYFVFYFYNGPPGQRTNLGRSTWDEIVVVLRREVKLAGTRSQWTVISDPGKGVVASGLQQQPTECKKTIWGIALEKPASLFLSLAPNNPRAWLSCAMGLRIPLKATLNGQKMLLPGFDSCTHNQYVWI